VKYIEKEGPGYVLQVVRVLGIGAKIVNRPSMHTVNIAIGSDAER
jgi:hypothetical protein